MRKLLFALLIELILLSTAVLAKEGDFCQNDTTCKSCEQKEGEKDNKCSSINGKRLDNGDSLGVHSILPNDSERHLITETYTLSDETPPARYETHEASEPQLKEIEKTAVDYKTTKDTGPLFVSGESDLTDRLKGQLTTLANKFRDKSNVKIQIEGHTDTQRLSPRAKAKYQDNYGLGLARAKKSAQFIANLLGKSVDDVLATSKGESQPVASNKNLTGMGLNRRIEIDVSYDEITKSVEKVALPAPEPVVIPPPQLKSCEEVIATRTRAKNQPFRISVDGVPTADIGTIDPDIQRCTDIGLERADIQVRYDALETTPWLNVAVSQNAAVFNKPITFNGYSNYRYWIKKAEVRVFSIDDTRQSTPINVIALNQDLKAEFIPQDLTVKKLQYLLRVYDDADRYDETKMQTLDVTTDERVIDDVQSAQRENLIGYGENRLEVRNIPVYGGAVTINGERVDTENQVRFLGELIPVDKNGKFAARQILPAGNHVVVVDVKDKSGADLMQFNRNLYIPDKDWFYIALADLTGGKNSTRGPAEIVTGDDQHFDNQGYLDGRLAFYLKGKIKGEWLLTASADTREQPLKNLFRNFDEKDPMFLIRRLDPDRYYPVYGDDSTTVEDAPTRGKFFVKLARGDSHVMWGSFQTHLSGADLVQFSRGMYGAGLNWRSDSSTSFGEKTTKTNLFAGDPGTLGAREQYRGTGGSLYYIQHQDVTRGSEKLWVEVRDKDSGIVLKVNQLIFGQDYDFDPIQGRIFLTGPLPSTADDSQLVRSSSLSGHPVFLNVTYEYTPNVIAIDNATVGGRVSHWLGDKVQVGATGYRQGDTLSRQKLYGVDATYRVGAGTYLKAETARSDGAGTTTQSSASGGFEFNGISSQGGKANANRVEGAVDLSEVSQKKGKVSAYWQDREAGFSSPGQVTQEDIAQTGFNAEIAATEALSLSFKGDLKNADSQDTRVLNAGARYQVNPNWAASLGYRHEDLETTIANASPTLSQDGKRDDASIQLEFVPNPDETKRDWRLYGYGQGTVRNTGNRPDNSRAGVGGDYRMNARLKLDGEISDGNGGLGGRIGADWRVNDRSQIYTNYTMDTDRTDSQYRGRQGVWTAGTKTRYTDNMNIFAEERSVHGSGVSGLTHAFGLDLAAQDGWNFGFKGEIGDLSDPLAGDFERKAASFSFGKSKEKTKYAGNLEWRDEDGSMLGERTTWLMRNSLSYQVNPDWRMLGKLNFSRSNSSLGSSFDADFTEAVLGYAYRPIENDKLNALVKYTYFDNLPSPAALSSAGVITDYAQRSHVFSVDAIYDLVPWLSIGGKYGFRKSEVKFGREDGDWVNSDAHLLVGRLDLHFVHDWDAMLEARYLDVRLAEDSRLGYLAAVYRHVNENVKVGVGYNFTDYSDDLTDQSYRSKGLFINVLSKF